MSFKGDLEKFAAKSKKNFELATRDVLFKLDQKLIERTPVGNRELWAMNSPERRAWRIQHGRPELLPVGYAGGRARNNWQYGFNVPPSGQLDAIDPTGTATMARNEAAISTHTEPGVHYIVNNLDYALALENGHSKQAPNGIVQLTAIEFQDVVDVAVRGIKK